MSALALAIDGMSCHHCLNAVNQALAAVPGVAIQSVRIGRAELSYDPTQADADRIIAAIAEAGYRAHAVNGPQA
jgi:copper chaperone CopZ